MLVVAHPNLANQIIELNPLQDDYTARIDSFGNGVLPELQSYRVAKVTVDAPTLPLGYDIGSSSYNVLPTYKSGTLIRIGSDATVILRGILVDKQKNPLQLKVIEVKSLEQPDYKPITFFTNRAGKFVAEGFEPGNYQGKVLGLKEGIIQFTIPADQVGIYDLGILQLTQ